MADLDQLSIQIESDAKKAEDAINSLISGLNNLNDALKGLDVSKITTFSNAMSKLSNIGNNTNTTAKAIKSMSSELASSFGIKTKRGVEDITIALQTLYQSARNQNLNPSDDNYNALFGNVQKLQDAIEANYRYKESVDETTKSIVDYVKAQNQSGHKVAMADMAKEFGEDFKNVSKVLGKSFRNTLDGTQALDLAAFFKDMNDSIGTTFKTGNDQELKQSIIDLVDILSNAKDKVYDFSEAVSSGFLNGEEAANAAYSILDRLFALIKEQDKYGASSGLSGLAQVFNQISNMHIPDFSGVADVLKQTQESTNKMGESSSKVEGVAKSIDDISQSAENALVNVNALGRSLVGVSIVMSNMAKNIPFGRILEGTTNGQKMIEDKSNSPIDTTGEWVEESETFKETAEAFQEAENKITQSAEKISAAKEKISKPAKMADVIENLIALGEALEKVSQKFGALGDKGIKLFKTMVTPLKWAANEYVEKFENMKASLDGFVKRFQKGMDKISQFWKRTMKTFTFMIVRKVFTAIIKEVGNAVQSLAMWSNAMGTAFNNDISLMVADFQYLGRSIISVFAPLLNTIAPIIDAIVDKIATLISYIGMLFAALGGGTSFTKAKKNVTNYAESLDSASKSAKNLTMGIDELNILNEKSGGGGAKPYDGWEDGWEQVEIPAWILNLSDWFKDLWDKIFDPLKEAWDRAKAYLINGFKTMVNALKDMFAAIGRDFLDVWNQEKTIRMFEQLLKIVGDLERVIRNLANNFTDAWNNAGNGKKIFENLRDIASILVNHARNISYYMIEWSQKINFNKLVSSFEKLTRKAKQLAKFVGGIVEDVTKTVFLEYIRYLAEDAIPHMNETIAEIIDRFNFTKLRQQLQPLWDAISSVMKEVHEGVTDTIGNIGKAIANFTNSREFEKFLQTIINLLNQITAERVEKILTGLAEGILAIAEAVVKFVNSKLFQAFIEFIGDWVDNHSSSDIAGILTKIAGAIAIFKFGEFAAEKLSGFFSFFTTITAIKNLATIASNFTNLSTSITGISKAASATNATNVTTFAGAIGKLGTNFLNLHTNIGFIPTALGSVITAFAEFKGVEKNVENLTHAIYGDGEKSLNGSILGLVGTVGIASVAFTALLGFPAGLIAAGAVGAVAAIKGIQDAIEEIHFEHISEAILTQGDVTVEEVREMYQNATDTILEHTKIWKDTERQLTQDRGDIDSYTKSLEGLTKAFESHAQVTGGMIDELVQKHKDLNDSIGNYIDDSVHAVEQQILAQSKYLESTGVDVGQMITDLYVYADDQKGALSKLEGNLDEAGKKASEAYEKLGQARDEFGVDSTEYAIASENYAKAQQEVTDAANALSKAQAQFQTDLDNLNTETAIDKIAKLGDSLNLSKYAKPEEAVSAIQTGIQEVTSTYTTGISDLKSTLKSKIEEYDGWAGVPTSAIQAAKDAAQREYDVANTELTNKTIDTLNIYQGALKDKITDVSKNAADKWHEIGGDLSGVTQAEYVRNETQKFLNMTLGEEGLQGDINDLYEALPGNVNNNVVTSMQQILDDQWDAYNTAYTYGNYGDIIPDLLQGILDDADKLDYDTPANTFNANIYNHMMKYANETDYDEFGNVVMAATGKSITTHDQAIQDAARLVSGEGVNALSDEWKEKLEPFAEDMRVLNYNFGKDNTQGLADGMVDNLDGTIQPSVKELFQYLQKTIHDQTEYGPFGSPNKAAIENGKDIVDGLNQGITDNADTTTNAIGTWFNTINTAIKNKLGEVKTTFNTMLTSIFSGTGWDYNSPITTLFTNVTSAISNNLNILGTTMIGTMLPEFVNTYLMPFFSQETWQPLFDMLREVFVYQLEDFKTWFTESMSEWWENDLTAIFKSEKWNAEIFTPLSENIKSQFEKFKTWWNKSMNDWWKDKVVFWFKSAKWDEEIYTPLKENLHKHFDNFIEYWDKSMNTWWKDKVLFWFKTLKWDEEIYTPLKDNLHKHWDAFIKWWDESLNKWWDEHVLVWFKDELWDNDIYNPIKENLYGHFESFLRWWDESLDDWWTNHVKPYFEAEKWAEQFDNVHEQADDSFGKVKEVIDECMSNASDAVSEACEGMANSLTKLIELIGNVEMNVKNFGNIGGNVSFNYSGQFASGGFPTMGSLFLAGENGAGAELVGNVGGKTGVVSNGEITGIADAVYATGNQESELLTQLLQVTQSLLDKDPVVIGDRDIAQMAQNGQSQMGMSIIS